MLSTLYLLYIIGRVTLDPNAAPLPKEERTFPIGMVVKNLITSFLPLTFLIGAVLGSILLGVATPTEAAALGAIGGLILAFAYKSLTFQNLKESVFLTARTTAMVGWLFVGSSLFAAVFARLGGSALIEQWVLSLGLTPFQFFWLAQIMIFLLGWPLEWTEITIIFLPLFLPLLKTYDIDPLFFGIMTALNQQTSFLSPPVAMSAFYLKGVAPRSVTINQIFRGMYPFLAIQVVRCWCCTTGRPCPLAAAGDLRLEHPVGAGILPRPPAVPARQQLRRPPLVTLTSAHRLPSAAARGMCTTLLGARAESAPRDLE